MGRPLVLKKPSRDHGAGAGSPQDRVSQSRTPDRVLGKMLNETEKTIFLDVS